MSFLDFSLCVFASLIVLLVVTVFFSDVNLVCVLFSFG